MTHKVTKPIALDESFRTTGLNPQNIADVLAGKLDAIKDAIENGGGDIDAAFVCYYSITTATQIYNAIESGKVPYFYNNGIVAQLWKVETDKYTFRATSTRDVSGETYLDIVDYIVDGSEWSTETQTISGGGQGQQAYLVKVSSSSIFDTTGLTGMQTVLSVDDVPNDGVYQVSVMMSITPKTASPTKSDLVFGFYGSDGTGMPNHTFHAVVDDSQTFAQQLSFSTTLNLKAGTTSLKMQCGGLNTEYLVFVDELTVAQLVNGVYHNGDTFEEVNDLTEAIDFNADDELLVVSPNSKRKMLWTTLANKVLGFIKSLSTTITSFRTGDVIPVDGPDGTAKMAKDTLLAITGKNAINYTSDYFINTEGFFPIVDRENGWLVLGTSVELFCRGVKIDLHSYNDLKFNGKVAIPFKDQYDSATLSMSSIVVLAIDIVNHKWAIRGQDKFNNIAGKSQYVVLGTAKVNYGATYTANSVSYVDVPFDFNFESIDGRYYLMSQYMPTIDRENGFVDFNGGSVSIFAKKGRIDLNSHADLLVGGRVKIPFKDLYDSANLSMSSVVVIGLDIINYKWVVRGHDKYNDFLVNPNIIIIGTARVNYGATYTANSVTWVDFPFETDFVCNNDNFVLFTNDFIPHVDRTNGIVYLQSTAGGDVSIFTKSGKITLSNYADLKINGRVAFPFKDQYDTALSMSSIVIIALDIVNHKWMVRAQDKIHHLSINPNCIVFGLARVNYGATYTANSVSWVDLHFENDFICNTDRFFLNTSGYVPHVDRENGRLILGNTEVAIFTKAGKIQLDNHADLKIDGVTALPFKDLYDTSLSMSSTVVVALDLVNFKWVVRGQDKYEHIRRNPNFITFGLVRCNYGATYTAGSVSWVDFPFETDFNLPSSGTGIFDFNPDSEIYPIVNNLTHRMRNSSFVLQAKQLVLLQFTDIHGDGTNLKRIVDFASHWSSYINDVIHCGDSVYDRWVNDFDFWANSGASGVMNVLGNHDVYFVDTEDQPVSVTQKQVYDRFFAPFIGTWGVTQPADASTYGYMYYYKDYTEQGIRMIVLDEYYYDATQESWVSSVLDDARTNGLAVILVRHQPFIADKYENCSFASVKDHGSNATLSSLLPIVDSFITAGGEFVMWLCGHTHQDYAGIIDGHPLQFQFATNYASMNHTGWSNDWRETGYKSQDCFTFISVDTYMKVVRFARIGANLDRYNREKNGFAVKYTTGEMIWCS